jgi:hypothetical protein
MQQSRVNRRVVFFSGLFANVVLWGGWFWITQEVIISFYSVSNGSPRVDINILGLWMPLGFLGVCFLGLASPLVAFFTGVKSSVVWGARGDKVANYVMVTFALLGLISGVVSYQWMTGQLEGRGYLYCKPLSRISAMGRHEVYVARPELCIKPSKIP